ncbi:MAG TPA: hypothetical protein VGN42_17190 [Pirellulales bacterium]|jgi:hypothetical protein|nr:hypothetical protein [Pirellulales bacterium]
MIAYAAPLNSACDIRRIGMFKLTGMRLREKGSGAKESPRQTWQKDVGQKK